MSANVALLGEAPFLILQLLLDGLMVGAIFAVAAYGMALVWGVMNVINVVQGELVMLGGFITYQLTLWGVSPLWGVPVAAIVLYFVGAALHHVVIRRVADRDMFISLLATFGLSILLQQLMNQIWGGDVKTAQSGLGTWFLLDYTVTVSQMKVAACGGAIAIGGVLILFLKRSRIGQAIRATAQNPRAARLLGIDTNRVFAVTYGINAALCGGRRRAGGDGLFGAPLYRAAVHRALFHDRDRGGPWPRRCGKLRRVHFGRAVPGRLRLLPPGGDPRHPQHAAAAAQAVPQVSGRRQSLLMLGVAAAGVALPFVIPDYRAQIAMLWALIIMAQTWDITGGQTGYNSFGNILFFGVGMYASVIVQRDVGLDYFPGLVLGMVVGAAIAATLAVLLGSMILRMRGHYFAIATLGLGIAAGEIAGGWDYLGAGSGLSPPLFPAAPSTANLFFAYLFFGVAALVFAALAALYRTRFGLALNAIRDNEDKAEAMGLHTGLYKITAWTMAAFVLGLVGGAMGNMLGFVDPRDTAFAGATFGVWMVLMAILGGKGTLWGPVLGAAIFHITQELLWTHLLGWQRVALGVIIVGIVVFFPQGILGWARTRWPARHAHHGRGSGRA